MVTPAIGMRDVTAKYGPVEAVSRLSFTVNTGECYGLLGLNGAGKTTTVKLLTGLLESAAGDVEVMGVHVGSEPDDVLPHVGVVFGENDAPEPWMSPVRYLRHFARLYGLLDNGDTRIRELLATLRLADDAERPIGALSGGNRRKVELARALLHEPPLLVLDEPTRELDIPSKRTVWLFLRQLLRGRNVSIIVCSHDLQEILTLCDRVGVLHRGRLVWEGGRQELGDGSDAMDLLTSLLEGRGTAERAR